MKGSWVSHYSRGEGTIYFLYAVDALRPLRDPRLSASPCDRLLIRTKPVIGPSSPSFSMLRFAKASSPGPS